MSKDIKRNLAASLLATSLAAEANVQECESSFSEAASQTYNYVQYGMRGTFDNQERQEQNYNERNPYTLSAGLKACQGPEAFKNLENTLVSAGAIIGAFGGAVSGTLLKNTTDLVGLTSPHQEQDTDTQPEINANAHTSELKL